MRVAGVVPCVSGTLRQAIDVITNAKPDKKKLIPTRRPSTQATVLGRRK
jgi:hypothetical protein